MALQNSLIKAQPNEEVVEYKAGGETISLSLDIVKRYLVSGDGVISDQEAYMFLNMCRYQNLNPFLREAYCIKFGNKPATMVVGKDTFIKRARHRSDFDGFQAGVIVKTQTGEVKEREGSFNVAGEAILGGWAKVYVKGYSVPFYSAVLWQEYCGKKADGKLNSMWASKPATMIRKVALSQALREAFPDDLGGLYEPEEINTIDMENLPEEPIEIPKQEQNKPEVVEAEVIEPNEEAVMASLFG